MEVLLTFGLIGLLTVAVCQLFNCKAGTTACFTIAALIIYAMVIGLMADVVPMFKTFTLWLKQLWVQIFG